MNWQNPKGMKHKIIKIQMHNEAIAKLRMVILYGDILTARKISTFISGKQLHELQSIFFFLSNDA